MLLDERRALCRHIRITLEEIRQGRGQELLGERSLRDFRPRCDCPRRDVEFPDTATLHNLDNEILDCLGPFSFLADRCAQCAEFILGCQPLLDERRQLTR